MLNTFSLSHLRAMAACIFFASHFGCWKGHGCLYHHCPATGKVPKEARPKKEIRDKIKVQMRIGGWGGLEKSADEEYIRSEVFIMEQASAKLWISSASFLYCFLFSRKHGICSHKTRCLFSVSTFVDHRHWKTPFQGATFHLKKHLLQEMLWWEGSRSLEKSKIGLFEGSTPVCLQSLRLVPDHFLSKCTGSFEKFRELDQQP